MIPISPQGQSRRVYGLRAAMAGLAVVSAALVIVPLQAGEHSTTGTQIPGLASGRPGGVAYGWVAWSRGSPTAFGRQADARFVRRELRSGEVIRTWHQIAASQPTNPVRQSWVLALVHAAMHDAVNGVVPEYERYASWLEDPSASAVAAAAAAAHRVLVELFPANGEALDAQLEVSLAGIPHGHARGAGVALGSAVGQHILAFRANDGMNVPDPFDPEPDPGIWEPTPPAFMSLVEPQMQNVTPFTMVNREQFDVTPPPHLLSNRYALDYNEVKIVGSDTSSARTADQTHYAHFWFEPSNLGWSRIAAIYTSRTHTNLHDTARLFTLLNMAMADGYISGWYWKRTYAFWRPITAIRKGESDGNPHTAPDPEWNSLRPTPPSPDYPSTHSVLGTAAARILREFTGSDRFAFCMASISSIPAGSERCYRRFSEAAQENADSRVYIGYHFRFATHAGMKLGNEIGAFAIRESLRPLRRHGPPARQ